MFNSSNYTNQYIRDNYDRISLNVPKGYKNRIKEQAKNKGFSNMSEYIVSLIENDGTKEINIDNHDGGNIIIQ